ncbi:MAG TPA: hypothetical protein VI072_17500 [Polyangiaceae bacterium]
MAYRGSHSPILQLTRGHRATLCSVALLAAPFANECGLPPSSTLPCDIDNILREKCQACHGTTPKYGAPMPLTTYADLLKPAPANPSAPVWKMMSWRVHHPTSPMPPSGQMPLTDSERARLTEYFAQQAPPGTAACTDLVPPGDLNSLTGPEYLPCTPNVRFTAHAVNSTNEYTVPTSYTNTYSCFTFRNPFPAGQHATAWAPILDNAAIVHHWVLFGMDSGTHGSVTRDDACYAAAGYGTTVAAWGPGGPNAVLDGDVSLGLDYPFYTLQVHHSNTTNVTQTDASGVAFCTGSPRQNVAGMITLGSTDINVPAGAMDFKGAESICDNLSIDGTPITIVSTSPHMHLLGRGFRTEHWGYDDLSYLPMGEYNFDVQRTYLQRPRRVVQPNQVLRTTCWYSNPSPRAVGYGPATTDEMCYDFLIGYPYDKAVNRCGDTL